MPPVIRSSTALSTRITHRTRWLPSVIRAHPTSARPLGSFPCAQNLPQQRGIRLPLYVTKLEKKGRVKGELDEVTEWLTGASSRSRSR